MKTTSPRLLLPLLFTVLCTQLLSLRAANEITPPLRAMVIWNQPSPWDEIKFIGFRIKNRDHLKPRFSENPVVASSSDLLEFIPIQKSDIQKQKIVLSFSPLLSKREDEKKIINDTAKLLSTAGFSVLVPYEEDGKSGYMDFVASK